MYRIERVAHEVGLTRLQRHRNSGDFADVPCNTMIAAKVEADFTAEAHT